MALTGDPLMNYQTLVAAGHKEKEAWKVAQKLHTDAIVERIKDKGGM